MAFSRQCSAASCCYMSCSSTARSHLLKIATLRRLTNMRCSTTTTSETTIHTQEGICRVIRSACMAESNTYLYVFANPVANTDPFGLETQPDSGKSTSYPSCFKWQTFPAKDCHCADKCAEGELKATRDCIKDCRWRYILAPGQALLLEVCSAVTQEWGRQCLLNCQ